MEYMFNIHFCGFGRARRLLRVVHPVTGWLTVISPRDENHDCSPGIYSQNISTWFQFILPVFRLPGNFISSGCMQKHIRFCIDAQYLQFKQRNINHVKEIRVWISDERTQGRRRPPAENINVLFLLSQKMALKPLCSHTYEHTNICTHTHTHRQTAFKLSEGWKLPYIFTVVKFNKRARQTRSNQNMLMESFPSIQTNDSIISFRTMAVNLRFRHVVQYIPAHWIRQWHPYTGEKELGINWTNKKR